MINHQYLCACMQEYYAAQCAHTKLNYEKKQLERKRDQLLSQWRTHDAATCRRPSSTPMTSSSMAAVASPAASFGVLPSSSLTVLPLTASLSTPVAGLGIGVPIDDDDDDDGTDDSDDEDEEESMDIIDELLMRELTDNMYDPLSRSLSCPAASDTNTEYESLMGFDDTRLDDPASRTAAAAGAQRIDREHMPLLPDSHGRRPESSSTRTTVRSRSLSLTYVEPAQSSLGTVTRTHSDTTEVDVRNAAPQSSSATTTQVLVENLPLHVRSLLSDSGVEDNQ